jgi:hypothetical protein
MSVDMETRAGMDERGRDEGRMGKWERDQKEKISQSGIKSRSYMAQQT